MSLLNTNITSFWQKELTVGKKGQKDTKPNAR